MIKKTIKDWQIVFDTWSKLMDILYTDKKERNDAASWDENPSTWMTIYDETIYDAWCNHDAGDPYWNVELEKAGMVFEVKE